MTETDPNKQHTQDGLITTKITFWRICLVLSKGHILFEEEI